MRRAALQTGAIAQQRGFTLVEVLVAALIFSLVAGFAVISLGNSGDRRELTEEASRLYELSRLASEQAIIYGKDVGLITAAQEYAFLESEQQAITDPDAPAQAPTQAPTATQGAAGFAANRASTAQAPQPTELVWVSLEDEAFRRRTLPDGIELTLLLEDLPADDDTADEDSPVKPQAVFLSTGEITPFELQVRQDGRAVYYRITADALGRIERTLVDPDAPAGPAADG